MGMSSMLLSLVWSGCGVSDRHPVGVPQEAARDLVLTSLPFAELVVPADSRAGREPPMDIPLRTAWRYTGESRQGMHKWATDIPIRPRGLFFHRPQPGMELRKGGKALRYDRFGKSKSPIWIHDRREIVVYTPEKGKAPAPATFVLSYPKATERERALNQAWSGKEAEEFVRTTIQDDWDSRRGLLLPAPGSAAWDLVIPPAGELRFTSGLVEPEIRDAEPSDGATLVVELDHGGRTEELYRAPLAVHAFTDHRLDLSGYADQQVRLRVRTEPGASAAFDYAFLAEPTVSSNRADPVRVLMVFVDTLRTDHLSLYGYGRDTSAAIDHLGASSTVFTQARSIAPWTLPSARTLVTGRQPEYYFEATTIQAALREQGWATAFFAGNVYLSNNFQMTRDWDFHRVGLWPSAEETTDDALRWLDDHEGRNSLLYVHYMSPHLPYVEPPEYRRKYAGDAPDGLREQFYLSDIRKAKIDSDPAAQQYVRDRYDNNIRYATDQIQRLVERLDDNDVLLFFADHGEEFWDHQGFEHGHTLYDELLRVPLVIRGPGVQAGTVDAPVSLLDVAPTVLELAGVPVPPEMEGRSLGPLLRREPAADAVFQGRDQAFGRPLYGPERWGVLQEHQKWTTTEGREQLFDLDVDAGEKRNLLKSEPDTDTGPYRAALGDALGRKVMTGYRLVPSAHRGDEKVVPGTWALCTVPGGFSAAWKADDPLENSDATVQTIADTATLRSQLDRFGFPEHPVEEGDGGIEVCWRPGWVGSREVYLGPARPVAEVGGQIRCSVFNGDGEGGQRGELAVPADRQVFGEDRTPLSKVNLDRRKVTLEYGIAPIPDERAIAVGGTDAESTDLLRAMGYLVPDSAEHTDSGCEPGRGGP